MTVGFATKSSITQKYSKQVSDRVQKEIVQLGLETREIARALCPVDSGALQASIYVSGVGTPNQQSAGYFRAIKAASKRNSRLFTDSPYIRNQRTQSRTPGYLADLKEERDAGMPGYDNQPFNQMTSAGAERYFVSIGAAAYYAGWVEFGTTGLRAQPAQPFMGPALRWAESQLVRRMRSAINGN